MRETNVTKISQKALQMSHSRDKYNENQPKSVINVSSMMQI
ncbi:hypothetical protein HMPREF1572_01448 [Gardnerella vaginalis JCP7275]|nr:hypothetical protein HMPREF1572_01448 [Gardnerella vaginalis JCP7275]